MSPVTFRVYSTSVGAVADGKVLPLGGKSKSGVVVDSIFMHVEFSDDPGTIYTISGHQRSGFLEDEY